jgi:hypothetical protein
MLRMSLRRRRHGWAAAPLALALLATLPLTAQEATTEATAPAESGTSASPPAVRTLTLTSGFLPDPHLIPINARHERDVAPDNLGIDCVGFVGDAPNLELTWPDASEQLRIFFIGNTDTTLIVQQPDGTYVCNDDVTFLMLDPSVSIPTPAAGVYRIWVGSYVQGDAIHGYLGLTEIANTQPGNIVTNLPGFVTVRLNP